MTVLSAWTFGTCDGASHSAAVLRDLVARGRVHVMDAVVVRWKATARAPRMSAVTSDGGRRQPALLDLVVGMTYAVPLLQAATGRGHLDDASSLKGIGVDEAFTNKMRDRLVPNSSALLVVSDDAAAEWLRTDLDQPDHPDLVTVGLKDDLPLEADPPTALRVHDVAHDPGPLLPEASPHGPIGSGAASALTSWDL